jgi:hypothetical protein
MSCPHGVWHEEDCEICVEQNKLHAQIAKLSEDLEAAVNLLRRVQDFPENMTPMRIGESVLQRDVRAFLSAHDVNAPKGEQQ